MSAVPARSLVVAFAFLLAAAAAPIAAAQEKPAPETKPAEDTQAPAAPAPTAPAPEPEGFSIAEVTLQTEDSRKALKELDGQLALPKELEKFEEAMYGRVLSIQDARRKTRDRLASEAPAQKALADLENEWQLYQKEIASWVNTLRVYGTQIDSVLAGLDTLSKPWKATRQRASEADAEAVVERVDAILAEVAVVEELARQRLTELIDLQDRISTMASVVDDSLDAVESAIEESRRRVFEADGVPLWRLPAHDELSQAWQRVREQFARDWGSLTAYISERRDQAIALLWLIFLTLLITAFLGSRLRTWAQEEPQLAETARVLRDPFSVAVLVGIASSGFFFPLAPALMTELTGLLMLIPALTLLPRIVDPPVRPIIFALAFLYLASGVRSTLDAAPILHRGLQFVELLVALVFLLWLMRPARLAKLEHPERIPAWLSPLVRLALATVVVSLVAAALGYSAFARILGQGLLISAYTAALLYGVYRVLSALLLAFLHTDLARRMRAVRVEEARIHGFTCRLFRLAGVLWWADITLGAYGIEGLFDEGLAAGIGSSLTIGSVTISVGDILLFIAVVAGAFFLSRFVRFILEEDVFPRVVLRRGVSNAISTTVHYSILIVGFLLAVAAAGMDLSRITLLAGAFGVGIGFGLQNIVNNFVSGLILLFERPIQVGDTIEVVGGLLGDVRRIGPRSSTVRTFDGAEVIVPNAMLVSDQVINWTLSDRRRRIAVTVGVKYGTDPGRVLEILRQTAAENETVLEDPTPLTIFHGFGDSSLDFELRCWIPRYEEGFSMKTQLLTTINAKLAEAGIEIPFPQRDLHLRSVDEPAREALEQTRGAESPQRKGIRLIPDESDGSGR